MSGRPEPSGKESAKGLLDDLRWYTKVEPAYHLVHWWASPEDASKGYGFLDKENTVLYEPDSRGRPRMRIEPWIWELLRRHPDFEPILKGYRSLLSRYPTVEMLSDRDGISHWARWNEERIAFFEPWKDRGTLMIEFLANHAHLAWADPRLATEKSPGVLDEEQRSHFSSLARLFVSDPRNLAKGTRLPPRNPVSPPLVPPETISPRYYYKSPLEYGPKGPEDYFLSEYIKSAEMRSHELLFLEISQEASVEVIIDAIWKHLMATRGLTGTVRSRANKSFLKDGSPDLLAIAENGAGGTASPKTKSESRDIRLSDNSLNLLAILDQGEIKGDAKARSNTRKGILAQFSKVRITP